MTLPFDGIPVAFRPRLARPDVGILGDSHPTRNGDAPS
jgi:hypothetical protein